MGRKSIARSVKVVKCKYCGVEYVLNDDTKRFHLHGAWCDDL